MARMAQPCLLRLCASAGRWLRGMMRCLVRMRFIPSCGPSRRSVSPAASLVFGPMSVMFLPCLWMASTKMLNRWRSLSSDRDSPANSELLAIMPSTICTSRCSSVSSPRLSSQPRSTPLASRTWLTFLALHRKRMRSPSSRLMCCNSSCMENPLRRTSTILVPSSSVCIRLMGVVPMWGESAGILTWSRKSRWMPPGSMVDKVGRDGSHLRPNVQR